MQKGVVIANLKEIRAHRKTILRTANRSAKVLLGLAQSKKGIQVLHSMKFDQIGCDPLDEKCPWNFIEQLNQTFTYLVTLQGAAHLIRRHPEAAPFTLNLGTASGPDICSADRTIAAEAFAATSPKSNDKLKKDILRLRKTGAKHKLVFFYCPKTLVRIPEITDVRIVSLSRL